MSEVVDVSAEPEVNITLVTSPPLHLEVSTSSNSLSLGKPSIPRLTLVTTPTEVVVSPAGSPGSKGDRGDPGKDGSGGGSGSTFSVTAGVTVSGHIVVRPRANGTVIPATNTLLSDASRPLWITLGAALAGGPVSVCSFGAVVEPSWSWADGPIFLGANGILTQTTPSSGSGAVFIAQVASPDGASALFWNPRTLYAL